jgi:hypothetical protein
VSLTASVCVSERGQITWRTDSNSLPTRAFPCRCITPFVSCGWAGGEHGVTRFPGSAAVSINGIRFSTYIIATLLSRCRSRCWDFFILAGNCYFMYQRHLGAFLCASSKARMGALALRSAETTVSVSVSLRQHAARMSPRTRRSGDLRPSCLCSTDRHRKN